MDGCAAYEGIAAIDCARDFVGVCWPTHNKASVVYLFSTNCMRIENINSFTTRRTAECELVLIERAAIFSVEATICCVRPDMSVRTLFVRRWPAYQSLDIQESLSGGPSSPILPVEVDLRSTITSKRSQRI
jgi:hypothetical protein